jgi:hypothetical protein
MDHLAAQTQQMSPRHSESTMSIHEKRRIRTPELCVECNSLLEELFAATSEHYEALSTLLAVTGRNDSCRFAEVRSNCEKSAQRYRRAVTDLRSHKGDGKCFNNIAREHLGTQQECGKFDVDDEFGNRHAKLRFH